MSFKFSFVQYLFFKQTRSICPFVKGDQSSKNKAKERYFTKYLEYVVIWLENCILCVKMLFKFLKNVTKLQQIITITTINFASEFLVIVYKVDK